MTFTWKVLSEEFIRKPKHHSKPEIEEFMDKNPILAKWIAPQQKKIVGREGTKYNKKCKLEKAVINKLDISMYLQLSEEFESIRGFMAGMI